MKRVLLSMLSVLLVLILSAQAPQAFKYQTVVRNASNAILDNQDVYFRISVLQGSSSGTVVYTENFSLQTNDFGLASFNIGQGTVEYGTFSSISWNSYEFWVKVELDPDASGTAIYEEVGTSQLLSVPYALNAKTAENAYWVKNVNDISYSTGNVGIGTSTPTGFLEVTDHGVNNPYNLIILGQTITSNRLRLSSGTNYAIISVGPTMDENKGLVIRHASGNVGINETNPDSKLHVAGNTHLANDLRVDGNIGIGITSPTAKLDLRGTMYAAGTTPFGTFKFVETTDSHTDVHENILTVQNASGDAASQANIMFAAGDGPGHGRAIISGAYDGTGDYDGKLTFKVRNGDVSYANALTLRSNGMVGINEPNPDAELHVNGDAHITGDLTVDGAVSVTSAPTNDADAVNKAYVDALVSRITGLVLWNKLGSESEVLSSDFGEDGSLVGTAHAYESGKYGNGYVRKDINSYVKFPKSVLQGLKSRGTVEVWVNPKVTNPSPGSYGAFMIVGYRINDLDAHVFIRWGDGTTGKGINGGVNFDGTVVSTPNEASQYVATINVPFHLAVCWDVKGIDGTNETVRMYRDGVLIGSTTTTWNDQGTVDYDDFKIGTGPDDEGYDKYITDNIKVWNYAKTNFSDRFHE